MNKTFKDNAPAKIVAWDFDNTLTMGDHFPKIGQPRPYGRQVMNLLHDLGVINLIWTCRDRSNNLDDEQHNDIAPAVKWLNDNGYKYHDVNTCIAYAPFHYEARKIYAHMYVDDRAYGWDNNNDEIMLDVMVSFLIKHMDMFPSDAYGIKFKMLNGEEVTAEWVKENCI